MNGEPSARSMLKSVSVPQFDHAVLSARAMLHAGRERSIDARRFLDRDYAGIALGWSVRATEERTIELAFEETHSTYVEYSQLFLGHRRDRLRELRTALPFRLAAGWSLTPQAIYQENRSNVVLASFRRSQLLVELRREY